MKKLFYFIFLFVLNASLICQTSTDPEILNVVQKVKRSRIMNNIRHLQSFGSRFMLNENRFEIANWIKSEFENMGFEQVELDSFICNSTIAITLPGTNYKVDTTTVQVNVIATLTGTERPDEIYIIGGHYDSFCENDNIFVTAPGADDDASGTTCAMEAARAIVEANYKPKSTLKFIAFAAEELGSFIDVMGSKNVAYEAGARGDNIKLVINNDMIGFNAQHIASASVNVAPTASFSRINKVVEICDAYGAINYIGEGYAEADLWGFIDMGYDGIYFEENDFPIQQHTNYHKNTDTWQNIDSLYITEVIKAATAVLISMEDILSNNEEEPLPLNFALEQNYPNPFNPCTVIQYSVGKTSKTTITVYNLLGETVRVLVDEVKSPGIYKTYFEAKDLSAGLYFYSITCGEYSLTKKMILLK